MSNLGFDVRPYCERLAKACPDRFEFDDWKSRDLWVLRDKHVGNKCFPDTLWAFFGPLAVERRIEASDVVVHQGGRRDLLACIIAAVVESFESEVKA